MQLMATPSKRPTVEDENHRNVGSWTPNEIVKFLRNRDELKAQSDLDTFFQRIIDEEIGDAAFLQLTQKDLRQELKVTLGTAKAVLGVISLLKGEEPVTKKPRTEQSFLASIRSAKEESKNDDDESDEYDDEPNPDPDPEPKLSSTRLSLPSQLQSVSTLCQMDLDVYTSRPSPNLLRRFELDAHFTRLLDNLTNLEEISLGGEVKALRLYIL